MIITFGKVNNFNSDSVLENSFATKIRTKKVDCENKITFQKHKTLSLITFPFTSITSFDLKQRDSLVWHGTGKLDRIAWKNVICNMLY